VSRIHFQYLQVRRTSYVIDDNHTSSSHLLLQTVTWHDSYDFDIHGMLTVNNRLTLITVVYVYA
jgi:hypothetical protein